MTLTELTGQILVAAKNIKKYEVNDIYSDDCLLEMQNVLKDSKSNYEGKKMLQSQMVKLKH